MHTRALVAALTIISALSTVLASSSAGASAAAPPRHYVGSLTCDAPTPSAEFLLPDAPDVRATLSAQGVGGDPDAIWIDLSIFDNDFAPGTFLAAGPFSAGAVGREFSWYGLMTSTTHFYRLNAHVGARWVELGRGSFETPNCSLVNWIICDRHAATNTVGFILPQSAADLPPGVAVPAPLIKQQNWLDLSLQDDGFLPGTFLGARTSLETPATYSWSGIANGLRHYYRWNTQWSDGAWHWLGRGSFVSLRCDGLPSMPLPAI